MDPLHSLAVERVHTFHFPETAGVWENLVEPESMTVAGAETPPPQMDLTC